MLSYFNRLATDDYYFIWDVRNHGIITGVTSQYMEWCGRFAATFTMDVFYKAFDVNYSYYVLFPILSALLIFGGVYLLLGNLASKLSFVITAVHKRLTAASFTALLFFLSVDIGESWFWFCGLSSYLWSIIAFVWGVVFLSDGKNTFFSTTLALLCFVYVGGSSEVYSVILGLFFTLYLFSNYRQSENFKSFLSVNKKAVIVYSALAISFVVFLIAPGNYLRDGLFPEHQFLYSFYITAKSFVKFGILYLPFKLPYIFIFAFPFLVVGDAIKSIEIKALKLSFKTFFIRISSAFTFILFIFFFIVSYVMVETGPPRIWFLISFLFSIYCTIVFFYAGYKGILKEKSLVDLKYSSVVFGIGLMLFHLVYQYPIASKYAKANDERIELITTLNKTIKGDSLVSLAPLPSPGMLYSTEIASDTSHFTNKELRLGYDLKFHVIVNR
jgi:hypothetical protein